MFYMEVSHLFLYIKIFEFNDFIPEIRFSFQSVFCRFYRYLSFTVYLVGFEILNASLPLFVDLVSSLMSIYMRTDVCDLHPVVS